MEVQTGFKTHQQGIFRLVHESRVTAWIYQVEENLKVVNPGTRLDGIDVARFDELDIVSCVKS